jgi:WD40 repeat protein
MNDGAQPILHLPNEINGDDMQSVDSRAFTHAHQVNVVAAHPSKPFFASGSDDCIVMVFNLDGAVERRLQGHEQGVSYVSWFHDGSLLASGSFDSTIRIWHFESAVCLHLLNDHSQDIRSVQWSPVCPRNCPYVVSGSADQTLRIWELFHDHAVCTKVLHKVSPVMSVCWSPDGSSFASATLDGLVQLWDAFSLLQIFEFHGHFKAALALSWNSDCQLLASGSLDATVRIWNVKYFVQVTVLENPGNPDFANDGTGAVSSVLWSPCRRWLFDASRAFGIRQWCTASWTCLWTRNIHTESVTSFSTVPAALPFLLSSSRDCTVRFWNPDTIMFPNFRAEYLDPSGRMFCAIADCVQKSRGASHSGWSMKVVDVLKVHHPVCYQRFQNWMHLSNHQLLWHGTRSTNIAGILQHGLKIAPPEAPPGG